MAQPYNHKELEVKWQKVWDDEKAFETSNDYSKPKFYALVGFPYPSGQGLHVGHPRPYTALDIVARKRRMQGYNVLYPMGWDAFGLPTENYAIKNHIHPKIVTKNNVERFKNQLHSLGYSFDWDREVNTTDPNYYKWTQWIFLKLFNAGLAYKSEMPINWCTECKVGLANEEVVNGVCERCGAEVVRKVKSQWMLKITEYADKLIQDLDGVDYIERVKVSQKNWIGKSQGAEVDFAIAGKDEKLRVYTTRPDTLGVVVNDVNPKCIGGIGEKKSNGGAQWYQQDRIYEDNCAMAVTTTANPYYQSNLRIRKLTPMECWRLMGFDDEDFNKAAQVNSNAQLYKQAGNSIVVNVLESIFRQMLTH